MNLPFEAENLHSPVRLVSKICCPPFRPNFLNSKIVFYFIFLLFYCRMYKKKKKGVCVWGGGGGGGGICSNDYNGL